MRILLLTILIGVSYLLSAQNDPVSYYTLDDQSLMDEGQGDRNGIVFGNPEIECGVVGQSLLFDGNDDYIQFPDNFSTLFGGPFSLSFYFQPGSGIGEQQLFSYTENCNDLRHFEITYSPGDRLLRVAYGEDQTYNITLELEHTLEANRCWYHVVLVREGRNQWLYVNNDLVDEQSTLISIIFNNPGFLNISEGPCVGSIFRRFNGKMDEIRLYNRRLSELEISNLYEAPQTVVTQDTLIFLGGEVDVRVNEACSRSYSWSPRTNVFDPFDAEPILRPDTTTTYTITFNEPNCQVTDEITVIVVDPDQVGCETLALPKAFTPNGDGINDVYGLSNPFVIDELISFRIYDRGGGLMFETSDPMATWDGNYNGQELNPGAYLYTINYMCDGEEKQQQGTVVILR
jgi:gliding motility-associated-like protein